MAFSFETENDDSILSEINVTPLVDVMLVLLIIFMITAPLMTMGMRVDLPQARSGMPMNNTPIILTIAADGQLQVNDDFVQRDNLPAILRSKIDHSSQVIYIKGDKSTPYGMVVSVLDQLVTSGFPRLSLVTNGKSQELAPLKKE